MSTEEKAKSVDTENTINKNMSDETIIHAISNSPQKCKDVNQFTHCDTDNQACSARDDAIIVEVLSGIAHEVVATLERNRSRFHSPEIDCSAKENKATVTRVEEDVKTESAAIPVLSAMEFVIPSQITVKKNKSVEKKSLQDALPEERHDLLKHEEYVYDEVNQLHSSCNPFLRPLLLQQEVVRSINMQVDAESLQQADTSVAKQVKENETPCMICDYTEIDTDVKKNRDMYFCHLLEMHDIMVDDVKLIADVRYYAIYWKKRFQEKSVAEICANSKVSITSGKKDYFFLCRALPEDHRLREELQLNRLKKLLLRQEFERKDNDFLGLCPFCTKHFRGNRIVLFNHMSQDHNFKAGHPDNIVNVHEFLAAIHERIDSGKCLFCEKKFQMRNLLREHMRKKSHRRLNPKDKEFDKYYIINYLEQGKTWQTLQAESDHLEGGDDWSGWNEKSKACVCFFCCSSFDKPCNVYQHMNVEHDFDFNRIRGDMQLSFYQQVKMMNYIRREVHVQQITAKAAANEIAAMILEQLTTSTQWNQQQYYFPTYEDDAMLCQIEEKDGLFEPEDTFVVGEDGIECLRLLKNSILCDLLTSGFFETSM